jgi:hypothetical protein
MPFAVLLLIVGGGVLTCRRRELTVNDAFWIVPGALYFALASLSALHFGVRLAMPAWAMFTLFAGASLERLLRTNAGRAVAAAAVAITIGGTVATFPNSLAYFNSFAGTPSENLRYLADSNIDWGQGLREAASWARKRGITKLHVSYFGFDQPHRFFYPIEIESVAPPWTAEMAKGDRLKPEPGWYAISGSLLAGNLFQIQFREYFAEFRRRQPDGVAGSIFFYRVD